LTSPAAKNILDSDLMQNEVGMPTQAGKKPIDLESVKKTEKAIFPPDMNKGRRVLGDILADVLQIGRDAAETSQKLAQKLRELTGSRLVILAALDEAEEGGPTTRILAVHPIERSGLLETPLIKGVVRQALETGHAEVLSNPDDEQKAEMDSLGLEFCPCLVFPLFIGERRVGAIMSLGLLDAKSIATVLEIEEMLSMVVAVILKNTLLQDRQERIRKALELEVAERQRAEDTLKKSEAQVRLLLDSTAEAIYGIDLRGDCTFANAACLQMLGYPEVARLLGRNMHELIHHTYPDGRPMAREDCHIYTAFREGRQMHRDDEVLWKADGSSFPAEYWSYPKIEDGKVTGAVVTFIDITERKRFEIRLEEKRRRLNAILEGTNVGTWEWNVQTGEVVFNERWAEIIGYTLAELAPLSIRTWAKYSHPEDLDKSNGILARHFSGEFPFYDCEVRMKHRNGVWVWVHDRGKVATWTKDGKPEWMFGTHQDITGRKMVEERIQHLASHDALTGLAGLRLANERLVWSLGLARRNKNLAAVMFIDLDGFKGVNDTLGHEAGDFVLKAIARRISASIRETDTVARIGGDEFILIATALHSKTDAAEIAGKIVRTVSEPVLFDGQKTAVGASIGIALFPLDSEDKDELIRKADAAMYQVKAAGKNAYGFAGGE